MTVPNWDIWWEFQGTGLEATYVHAALSEGFCPVHKKRLEPRTPKRVEYASGYCDVCEARWGAWTPDHEHLPYSWGMDE